VKVRENDYLLLKETLFSNKTYLESQEKVLCHNDSQRSNIVKDLNNNYYLIDFEFVANNDPIYDIAAFGNGKVSEGLEVLKETYPSLDNDKLSRYYLWRIFLSLQWYNVALVKHYRGEGKTHNIDFLGVASHFLGNAKDALKGLEEIKK
jgi:thiamine kinase-like enzyme